MARQPHRSPVRGYRGRTIPREGETTFQVVVEESDLWVTAREDMSGLVHDRLRHLRGGLKAWMILHPEFGPSLAPLDADRTASPLVREMCLACRPWNVGPMAAVAGAVAEGVARAVGERSADAIVENGGDVFVLSSRDRVVGLLPDPESDVTLGLSFSAAQFPLAICASSAAIGHSLSLGAGDLVVAVGPNGAFSDAAATALCNMLTGRQDLQRVLDAAQAMSRPDGDRPETHVLTGLVAQLGQDLAAWGDIEFTTV